MRSIGLLAAVTGTLVLASSCSDGSGTPPSDNQAPVANFVAPACAVGTPCNFVSTSTDDVEVTSWAWDFDGDTRPDANTASASYTYGAPATINVSLTVRDAGGLSHTKTLSITVAANAAPTAGFTSSCTAADCSFISTSTDVAPGSIVTYAWDFGDEGTADVSNPSHSYTVTAPTEFTVTLTVTDNEGATAVATQTITVTPGAPVNPPVAGFTHTCLGAACSFVSTSTDVAPGTIATYAWTFGDGATSNVRNPSHSYTIAAVTDFTVTLTVTDNEGGTAIASKTITVDPTPPANQPPVARFTYSCAAAVCTFVNTSYDHGGRVTASAWTFGDGSVSAETSPSHSYAISAAAEFTVTLTVTDNEGATDIESITIRLDPNAANPPPTASFTAWCHGESCIFTSTSTDAAPGAIAAYAWTFGDGGTEDWRKPSHVYSIAGRTTFTVTLTVTDNEGANAVATKTVTVTPLPPAVQGCTTSGRIVECVLDLPQRSTLKATIVGVNCALVERVATPPPVGDQLFVNVCSNKVGDAIGIFGGELDELWVYEAGSQARIWFVQDDKAPRPLAPPQGRVEGNFPDWTLHFDDGDFPGAPGEPDFSDLILGIKATVR